eukprot:CAMPEP_0182901998 /NCGR_PEP_ID=MMETSP0034_2-20130328/30123_1 /TAXON_ID=156128 /ORGANISM="Nephroselmis pyriformis, Strain CCMP717" /LENGTH=437 /DNA_ID=CAMNT_0025036557 /DNA_START=1 /DNA_END=1311 /DNA_ORIENTATION=-
MTPCGIHCPSRERPRLPPAALGRGRVATLGSPAAISCRPPLSRAAVGAGRQRQGRVAPSISCKVVGIDLGTTNSAVAMVEGGIAQIIPSSEGERTTPSVVAFSKGGGMLVGAAARRQAVLNPENTYASVKRVIGREIDDVVADGGAGRLAYGIVLGGADGGSLTLACPATGQTLAPEDVSAEVLKKLKADAEAFIGEEVTGAVISVPAHFTDRQRTATKAAAAAAGLPVLRVISEPTAAAVAYGFQKLDNEIILVYDLGGGTLDVTILEVGDQVFEVLSTQGDSFLGGDDWDHAIVTWAAEEVLHSTGADPRNSPRDLQWLKEAAEDAKIRIGSGEDEVEFKVPGGSFAAGGGADSAPLVLTREKLSELCYGLLERARAPLLQAFEGAETAEGDKVDFERVDEVILVGGGTLLPEVEAMVSDAVGGRKCNKSVAPME